MASIALNPYICNGIKVKQEGNDIVPFFFIHSLTNSMEAQKELITGYITNHLGENNPVFLVNIKILAGNSIKVFLDGDEGVKISDCTQLSRKLYNEIEENGLFINNDFALEVSSAGIGEPLLLHRQYVKNISRYLEVKLTEGTILLGDLKEVNEKSIVISELKGKGKKAEIIDHTINFENIKTAIVEVKF